MAADNEGTLIKERTCMCTHIHTDTSRKRGKKRKGLLLDHMVILEQGAKVSLNVNMQPKTRHKEKDRREWR